MDWRVMIHNRRRAPAGHYQGLRRRGTETPEVAGRFERDESAHAVPEQRIRAVGQRQHVPGEAVGDGRYARHQLLGAASFAAGKLDGAELDPVRHHGAPWKEEGRAPTGVRHAIEAQSGGWPLVDDKPGRGHLLLGLLTGMAGRDAVTPFAVRDRHSRLEP
jgi:hypothetical protein